MLEKSDLEQIRVIIKSELSEEIAPVKKSLHRLEVESRKTRRDIKMIIGVFDEKDIELEKRVERLETKVGIVN